MEYYIALIIMGLGALGMAWMPSIGNRLRISYALIYLGIGILIYVLFPTLPKLNFQADNKITVRLTELVVLVALMGSGLKIDQPFSFRKWKMPLRLVTIGMLACIGVTAFIAWYWIGMELPTALLLAAVLAPTDPVLASDVQVGPPNEKDKDTVKFTLTAEGGMNDGTAFPFVWLAILLVANTDTSTDLWIKWLGFTLIYKIGAGLITGYFMGRLLAYVLFKLPEKYRVLRIEDGFVALSITLLVYGITELISGYGFIAVFTCAVTLRNYEMGHKLHATLHAFSDQIERILVAITLFLFGGALAGGLLSALTPSLAVFGVIFILVIRPITTWFFTDRKALPEERIMISFFGIRGIGSIYYTAFALYEAEFKWQKELWSTVAFIIVCSIIIHGITANVAIRKLNALRKQKGKA